jgi:hypothetical protein
MAEIELRVLTVRYLSRRIADSATIRCQVQAWETARNAPDVHIDWQFTADDARFTSNRSTPRIEE